MPTMHSNSVEIVQTHSALGTFFTGNKIDKGGIYLIIKGCV